MTGVCALHINLVIICAVAVWALQLTTKNLHLFYDLTSSVSAVAVVLAHCTENFCSKTRSPVAGMTTLPITRLTWEAASCELLLLVLLVSVVS